MSNSGPGAPMSGAEFAAISRDTFNLTVEALESGDKETRGEALDALNRSVPFLWVRPTM